MRSIKANYHTHSTYSDGKAPLAEYAKEAINQGLDHLGFSEHSSLPFPNSFALKEGSISQYLADISDLQKQYKGEIQLFAGLEMDFIPGFSQGFAEMKSRNKLDYVIGGVHLVLGEEEEGLWFIDGKYSQIYDDGLKYYFKGDARVAVTAYYRQLQRMIREESPDIVAHLDKIKMHNKNRFFTEDDPWYVTLVLETLEEIRQKGAIVEVNTRGLYKKRCEAFFPGEFILKEILKMNIPVILSSDAHAPGELTMMFSEAINTLSTLGFRKLSVITPEGWGESIF
ncbi:MAG: histidinol-phosphatase [Bacteroidetes bacterium]|nr:histidinol-phosphatase [Bacteroidota bacterium]